MRASTSSGGSPPSAGSGPIGHHVHRRAIPRLRFSRSRTDRVLAGVAGGIGERLGIDPLIVRLAFAVLSLAGGFGLLVYLFAWLLTDEPPPEAGASIRPEPARPSEVRQTLSVALVVAGLLLLLRQAGLWFGDGVVISASVAAFGSALIWARGDGPGRERLARVASKISRNPLQVFTGEVSRVRIAGGAVLIAAGMVAFLAASAPLSAVRGVAVAILVTIAGLGLLLGPWMWRLARQLGEERRERIRSEERAEVAAHLHDSVLQTLALIQRSSEPQDMAALARAQERELRTWLYGRSTSVDGTQMLSAAIDGAAAKVERLHHVPVETVVVGDEPMDERLRALVDAAAEAMQNAARHSGASVVSVYAEAGPEAVSLFVRDEGAGFRTGELPDDRRGISDSIVGRMERNGGQATIVSRPAEGTEVTLRMPRRPS